MKNVFWGQRMSIQCCGFAVRSIIVCSQGKRFKKGISVRNFCPRLWLMCDPGSWTVYAKGGDRHHFSWNVCRCVWTGPEKAPIIKDNNYIWAAFFWDDTLGLMHSKAIFLTLSEFSHVKCFQISDQSLWDPEIVQQYMYVLHVFNRANSWHHITKHNPEHNCEALEALAPSE